MDNYLTRLGINPAVQALFNFRNGSFDYGDSEEQIRPDFHFIPSSRNLWIAGSRTATELFISRSAVECLAYLSLNLSRIRQPENLCFIAVGNQPQTSQFIWIAQIFSKRKITLLFENDLTGCATDIVVVAWLRKQQVDLYWSEGYVLVAYAGRAASFRPEELSLNAFQKTFGLRMRIRTRKPLYHSTFLAQLKHDNYK